MTEVRLHPLDRLVEILKEERSAIGQLDTARLVTLVEEKESLVNLMVRETLPSKEEATHVARVLAEARANAMLIETAIDLLTEHLGQNGEGPTYDQRGRISRSAASAARTRI